MIDRNPTRSAARSVRNSSAIGSLRFVAASCSIALRYSGLSSSFARMYSASANSTIDARNGTRHAHSRSPSWPASEARKNASVASEMPAGGHDRMSEVMSPRRRGGANSDTIVAAPASSAPAPKPCTSRSSTSSTGAASPIAAAVGSRPMPTVATPIRITVSSIAGRRPTRSPMCPMTTPPSGRAMNPTAKVAKAASSAPIGTSPKNSGAITTLAAAPYSA